VIIVNITLVLKDKRKVRDVISQIARSLDIGIGVAEYSEEKEREFVTLQEVTDFPNLERIMEPPQVDLSNKIKKGGTYQEEVI